MTSLGNFGRKALIATLFVAAAVPAYAQSRGGGGGSGSEGGGDGGGNPALECVGGACITITEIALPNYQKKKVVFGCSDNRFAYSEITRRCERLPG